MTGHVDAAIILAAGHGARLAPTGHDRPKGFVRLGSHPIVEESVLRLADAGIGRIIVVTGYWPDPYRRLAARYGDLIQLVHNERHLDLGSMHSLALAAAGTRGDVLILESDLVYERRALDSVIDHPATDVTLVSGFTGAGDEVFVEASDDLRLVALSKDRERLGPRVLGEMVGITRVSSTCLATMVTIAQDSAAASSLAYETVLGQAAIEMPVSCSFVHDLIWTEIDDAAQLDRARRVVYPSVIARDGEPPVADVA